jgi:hypothetical protein
MSPPDRQPIAARRQVGVGRSQRREVVIPPTADAIIKGHAGDRIEEVLQAVDPVVEQVGDLVGGVVEARRVGGVERAVAGVGVEVHPACEANRVFPLRVACQIRKASL